MFQHVQIEPQPFVEHTDEDQSLHLQITASGLAGLPGQPRERELDAWRRTPARIRQLRDQPGAVRCTIGF